mmetsp:Transcript_19100/g.27691  ORF Transcript_19100/g.27691 Transcript_19100/m.27691 type:complete len:248 (-) Transcript_19100:385-1128(-)
MSANSSTKGQLEFSDVPRGLENKRLAWFYMGVFLKVDRTLDSRVWGMQRTNFQKSAGPDGWRYALFAAVQIPSSCVSGSSPGLDRLSSLQLSSSVSSEAECIANSGAAAESDYDLPRFEVKIEEIAESTGLDSAACMASSESPPAQTHQKETDTYMESYGSPPVAEGSPPKRNRTEKERPRCDLCNTTYVSNSAVRRHFRTVHEKRWKYECSCGKRFYHQSDYYRHQAGKNHDKKLPRTGEFSDEIS